MKDQERRDMNDDNTQDAAEPSPASVGSGAKCPTCGGLRLTRAERVAISFIAHNDPKDGFVRRTWLEFKTALCGLLERTRETSK